MHKEKQHFDALLEGLTELEFIQLFIHNGLENYLNEAMLRNAKPLDLYWFWIRMTHGGRFPHPKDVKPPTFIFRVGMEECPVANVPLKKYGLVRITYMELGSYIWHLFITQFQKMAFRKPLFKEEEERWLQPLWDILDQVKLENIPLVVAKPERKATEVFVKKETVILDVADMEDIARIAPPCISSCLNAKRFVYNNEAVRLIPILQEAGVPFDTLSRWMERKNAAYPHEKTAYKDADARRQYTLLWNAKRGRQYCANIVGDTLAGKSNVLTCPFAREPDHKKACAPEEVNEFKGPDVLIRRRIKRK
jgi:hypothetical protein